MSKVILITGSNTGIGLDLARVLAEKKHTVYISARNEISGKEALATLHSEGLSTVKFVHLDVTKPDTITAARETIEAAEGYLDVLVNNAAVGVITVDQKAPTISVDTLRTAMETNFYGVVQTTSIFLPLLRKSKCPVILNVTSGLGSNTYQSRPDAGNHYVAYNSTKAALNSYTIALAHELKAENIKVNAVTPGFTATQLNQYAAAAAPVREGTNALVPWTLIDSDGPTGKFFGPDGKSEFPW